MNSAVLESLGETKIDDEDFPSVSSSETDDDVIPGGEATKSATRVFPSSSKRRSLGSRLEVSADVKRCKLGISSRLEVRRRYLELTDASTPANE